MANLYTIDLVAASTQYLSRADTAVLDPGTNFTIEGWFKMNAEVLGGETPTLVSKFLSAGDQRSWVLNLARDGAQHKIEFISYTNGVTAVDVLVNITSLGTTWNHIAAVYTKATPQVEIYVNGVSVGTGTAAASIFDGTAAFVIGALNNPALPMDGKADDVRFWNDIRTTAEIADNMSNCNFVDPADGSLIGWWTLENVLTDSGPNGLTLTNNNSATFQSATLPYACAVATPKPTLLLMGVG